jgi:hypothetical protein
VKLSPEEIQEVVFEVEELIKQLAITDAPVGELDLVNVDAVPVRGEGTLEVVLGYLNDSFLYLNELLQAAQGWTVEIGIVDEHSSQGYLELMWSLRKKRAGSLNAPHVIIRRDRDWYEVRLPEQE